MDRIGNLNGSKSVNCDFVQQQKVLIRDEDPTFFSTDPDPAQLKKNSGSSDPFPGKIYIAADLT